MKHNYAITAVFEDENGITDTDTEIVSAKSKIKAIKKLENETVQCSVLEILKVVKNPSIGLAVMRMQPMHDGHFQLITRMMREMDVVIIGLGSTQEFGTVNNPYTPKQRREMVEKVFGPTGKHSKIKIVELRDLGAVSKIAWAMHVYGKIDGMNLPKPTHYYAGSKHDASWFNSVNEEFGEDSLHIRIIDRLRDTICMSGTEIRKAIMDESDEWHEFVPPTSIEYIEEMFPNELKLSQNIDMEAEKAKFELKKG